MIDAASLLKEADDYHVEILEVLGSVFIEIPDRREFSNIFVELGKYVIQKLKQQSIILSDEIICTVAYIKRWSTTERRGRFFVTGKKKSTEDYLSKIESRFNFLFGKQETEEDFINIIKNIVGIIGDDNSLQAFINQLNKYSGKEKYFYAVNALNNIDSQLKLEQLEKMSDESIFPEQKVAVNILKCFHQMGLLNSKRSESLQAIYNQSKEKGPKAWHEANILAIQMLSIFLMPILNKHPDKSEEIKKWNNIVIAAYSHFCVKGSIPEIEALYELINKNFWETSENQKVIQNYLDVLSELKSETEKTLSGSHQEEFIQVFMTVIISKIENYKEIINTNYNQINELGCFLDLLQSAIPLHASEARVELSSKTKELEDEVNKANTANTEIDAYLDDFGVTAKEVADKFINDLDFFDSTFEAPNTDHQQDYQMLISHYESYISTLDILSDKLIILDTNKFFDTTKKIFAEIDYILNQDPDNYLLRVFNTYRNYLYSKFQNIENNLKEKLSDNILKIEELKGNIEIALLMVSKYAERKLKEKTALTATLFPALEKEPESRKRARSPEPRPGFSRVKRQKITDFFHPKEAESVPCGKTDAVDETLKDEATDDFSSQVGTRCSQ
jgi:hypothetical protein